ncbi:MAG: ornithine cyclodeaminase family protein [Azonexus sp.]
MALFLSEADVRQVLTVDMALEAVEEAHRELALGQAQDTPRARTRLPRTALHVLQGALPSQRVIGYKAYTSNRSGNRFWVHLFDTETGEPTAIIAADFLGMMRTGAASGVATRWLARSDAKTLGLFGAGWQAEGHLRAVCAVRPIERVRVHARRVDRLSEFCKRMSEALSIPVEPADSPAATVEGADIVGTVTTASDPVFDAAGLAPGVHINAAGSNALIRRELSEETLRRCSLICVDSIPTALAEAGDLFPFLEKGRTHPRQWVELGEILIGRRSGRTAADQITVFESQGLAVQDLALAVRILAAAQQQGLGVLLPHG